MIIYFNFNKINNFKFKQSQDQRNLYHNDFHRIPNMVYNRTSNLWVIYRGLHGSKKHNRRSYLTEPYYYENTCIINGKLVHEVIEVILRGYTGSVIFP